MPAPFGRVPVILALAALAAFAQTAPTAPEIARLLTANDLKADVSFLASDALKGRATPSPGLEIAAEYLAAQFRRAGLEPAGDDGYFQTARLRSVESNSRAKATAKAAARPAEYVKLRNVLGVLRGSDPALKDTYLVVSAHYDHLGMRRGGDGDRVFNGANDDASGAATVVEIARVLAAQPAKPKRSIVFALFSGEEKEELGSRYYTQHPVFPLAKTIADLNLEQLGRTDDAQGSRIGQFNLTGFDYTDLAPVIRRAAQAAGVQVVKDEKNNERYFEASDNLPFAKAGVPSTTASVTYDFPDYHGVGDEWPKLDYDNMAKIDSALALAVFRLADSADAPQWNVENPRTEAFVKARAGK